MNFSRRLFIRATAGIVAAVVASPVAVALNARPELWGDGAHDDWPALDFLLRESARTGGEVVLRNTVIAISRPLGSVPKCLFHMEGVEIRALPNFVGDAILDWSDGVTAVRCKIIGNGNRGVAGIGVNLWQHAAG